MRSVITEAWRASATRWILLVATAVCATGWVLDVRPIEPVWGPIGTWVGGTATTLGLIFTGLQIRDSRRQRVDEQSRREQSEIDQREAMARAVSVSSNLTQSGPDDSWSVQYTIVNGSDYPIDTVVLFLHDHGQWGNDEIDGRPIPREIVIGSMYQKQRIEDGEPVEGRPNVPFALLTGMGELRFTDTWGQAWARSPGSIRKMAAPARMC